MDNTIITVFGSSAPAEGSPAYERARLTGELIAREGWIVCNGGYGGTMEASARGSIEAGGKAIGVTSSFYRSTANRYITEEVKTKNVVERLLRLVELAHGYVVLPGGTGTLVEFATVWEYITKGVMNPRPVAAFSDFWKPVVNTINTALAEEGKSDRSAFIQLCNTPEEAISILKHTLKQKKE